MILKRPFFWCGLAFPAVAAITLVLYYEGLLLLPKSAKPDFRTFVIKEGTSLRELAEQLESQGLIPSAAALKIWAIYKGFSGKIKAGEYRTSPDMAPRAILEVFLKGDVYLHKVTIPEGANLRRIAEILSREGIVGKEEFLRKASDPDYTRRFGFETAGLEGFLFPDTYLFPKATPVDRVIEVMVGRFREVISPLMGTPPPMSMTMEEIVTLASIIEKETSRPEERPLVAGVMINRLKKGMPLASDPTVIYAIENFDGNLRKADLDRPSPYNTYKIKGLPPGPIASPGVESIKAALNPAETDFFYFVSRNDGTHVFSNTYDEHRRAVGQYQKKRSEDGQKSP